MKRVFVAAVLAASLCVGSVSSLSAAIIADLDNPTSYTIEEVNLAGGIIVGDKLFDEFSVVSGPGAPDASNISLTGVLLNGEYALKFNGGWLAGPGQTRDTTIIFQVTVTDPPWVIYANTLSMAGHGASGDGGVAITENVYLVNPDTVLNPQSIADKFVYYFSPAVQQTFDYAEFVDPDTQQPAAYASVWVVKDVVVTGGTEGTAHLSNFYQAFLQVPEPASITLLGMGALFVLKRRR